MHKVPLLSLPLLGLLGLSGCIPLRATRRPVEPPLAAVRPTVIPYADTEAFDALLEAALTRQDPLIVIPTGYPRPEWEGRLSAWIAAWSQGGKVVPSPEGRRGRPGVVRAAAHEADEAADPEVGVQIVIDDAMLERMERLARQTCAWWGEKRVKARRVALLRPYNLTFELDGEGNIQIVLYNGRYA